MIVRTFFGKTLLLSTLIATTLFTHAAQDNNSDIYLPTREDLEQGDVEIIAAEDKTIYEFRVSGRLIAIKVIPKIGPAYYMVPTDGSAHYKSLDHNEALYPSWVLFEW